MTGRNNDLISKESSTLLVVDVQARLAPMIDQIDDVMTHNAALVKAAVKLEVPILFTEQYPAGLGSTAPSLRNAAPAADVFEKVRFDATAEPGFVDLLKRSGRNKIIVTGTEAHVCVLQTCLGLLNAGFEAHLVVDAIGSRKPLDKATAIKRLSARGASCVTTEMVLFEWLGLADTDEFRALLPIIRALTEKTGSAERASPHSERVQEGELFKR